MLNGSFSAFITVCAFVYIEIYRLTRSCSFSVSRREKLIAGTACFLLNFCLAAAMPGTFPFNSFQVLAPFLLIADVDMMIQKIPSELLLLGFLLSIFYRPLLFARIFMSLCILVTGLILSKKTGIANYDVILTSIMAMHCYDVLSQIKFVSIILILWGISGLIIQVLIKNNTPRKIPLSPIILSAYAISMHLIFQ